MNTRALLSPRETEIAELISWGATTKDVANRLSISCRTVQTIVQFVYKKTGVTKVNELSAWWFCTHFNISFELSPLKKSMVAFIFLLIWIPFELTTAADALRTSRTRTKTENVGTRSGRKSEYQIEF